MDYDFLVIGVARVLNKVKIQEMKTLKPVDSEFKRGITLHSKSTTSNRYYRISAITELMFPYPKGRCAFSVLYFRFAFKYLS